MEPNILATMGKPLCLFRYFSRSYREKTDSPAQCATHDNFAPGQDIMINNIPSGLSERLALPTPAHS